MLSDHAQTLIIGTGLLGASLGLAMKAKGYRGEILGLNRSRQTSQMALERGAIDAIADGSEAAAGARLIVVAVPLSAFASVFRDLAPHVNPVAVITDLGSTKTSVQSAAEAHLPDISRFVGAHPMAGATQSGPEFADATLFADKPCLICPSPESATDAQAVVHELFTALDMRLTTMTPAEHDRHVAYTSHLPHALAVALVHAAAVDCAGSNASSEPSSKPSSKPPGLSTASTGFRAASRLARSNPSMRADIMNANRDALAEALQHAEARLAELRHALDDPAALRATLETALSILESHDQSSKGSS